MENKTVEYILIGIAALIGFITFPPVFLFSILGVSILAIILLKT